MVEAHSKCKVNTKSVFIDKIIFIFDFITDSRNIIIIYKVAHS